MHRSKGRGVGANMNNSLSDLLEVMELSPKAKSGDSLSVGTKDSLRKSSDEKLSKRGAKKSILSAPCEGSFSDHSMSDMFGSSYSLNDSKSMDLNDPAETTIAAPTTKIKEGSTPKRSKRGGKKSDEKIDLERSLSGLDFDEENDPKARRVPKDCQSVSTMDSIDREKSHTKTSKRGGKKNSSQGKLDLERSLSGLDFEDDNVRNAKSLPSDCQTVSTTNSIDKEKSSNKPSKRGGKKSSALGISDLERSLSGLNFEDENLFNNVKGTTNDCQTVSTMDSLQREKSASKTPKRGGKKNESPMAFQPTYEKSKSLSLTSSLSKLGGPQRDFGRHADDNDTFCDAAGDDRAQSSNNKTLIPHMQQPFMKSPALARSDDSDSDDDDDLFASFPGSNPFRLRTQL